MDPRIKEDILSVLKEAVEALSAANYNQLDALSNHTIHDASIYQDEDSTSTAILMYAMAKVAQRCTETNCPVPVFTPLLEKARVALLKDKDNLFHAAFAEVFDLISSHDEHLKMYIGEVLDKARIKKGSKLAEHGISVARIAEMLGINQWDLYSYLGKTMIGEKEGTDGTLKRIQFARQLFS